MPFGHLDSADRSGLVALLAAAAFLCVAPSRAQGTYSGSRMPTQQITLPPLPPSTIDHLQGVVLNSLDGKPVSRVLVTTMGNQGLAVLTDYQGRFSFDLRRQLPQSSQGSGALTGGAQTLTLSFNLRKPGFAATTQTAAVPRFTPSGPEPELRLLITPAGLISGHVTSSTGALPPFLNVQLRRKQINDGVSFYTPVASAQVDASGDYRFPELTSGDYKITTLGSVETDTPTRARNSQSGSVPGFLPTTYPNLTSPDSAPAIHIGPGAAAVADLNLRPAPFYRVTIPLPPSDTGSGVMATLAPEAPGLMLSYNPREGAIVGYLPDGAYTVHLRTARRAVLRDLTAPVRGARAHIDSSQESVTLTGTVNLQVADAPVKTGVAVLNPGFDLAINVNREFSSDDTSQSANSPVLALSNGLPIANPLTVPVMLTLIPLDLSNGFITSATSVPQPDGQLHMPNVSEGTYRVRVVARLSAYVASMACGSVNLLREPLVVGPSGLTCPIEITLRNDGAALKLDLDSSVAPNEPSPAQPLATINVIPLDAPEAQALSTVQALPSSATSPFPGNIGQFSNLAPGRYLVLAERSRSNPLNSLEYHDPKVLESLLARGTVITLSANQKAEIRVPVLPAEPEN